MSKKNYIIICTNKYCEPGSDEDKTWAYVSDINIDETKPGKINLCMENNKNSDADKFEEILVHELFHLCDKDAAPPEEPTLNEKAPCSEWRDYTMMFCVYGSSYYEQKQSEYEKKCEEATN